MQTDPEPAFSGPMTSRSNTLLPVPLRPSTARVSPRFTVKLIPFKTVRPSNALRTSLTSITGTLVRSSGSCRLIGISEAVLKSFSSLLTPGSLEDHQDQLHQQDVSQNHEERGKNH